ncbi:hypothetical protein FQR65_LT16380 [Abscondita terminalis]|nr:hypothetical protein FQR65_LT16380 [Abscondita terminalis]
MTTHKYFTMTTAAISCIREFPLRPRKEPPYLNITLRHKVALITTTVNSIGWGNILSINNATLSPHYTSGNFALSTGNINFGNSTSATTQLRFPASGFPGLTQKADSMFVNADTVGSNATDSRNQFVLEFLDYLVDAPRYSIDECVERGLTYSVPLKARLKLYCTDPEHEDFQTVVQDVYLGPVPYYDSQRLIYHNGAERVIDKLQLHPFTGGILRTRPIMHGTKLLLFPELYPFKRFLDGIYNRYHSVMAIGYESDKRIFYRFLNSSEEVKVSKAALKKIEGRVLAARV